MRGSIVCIAMCCLSLISGALTDEGGKTLFKSYNFGKGDVIHALQPFVKDELVYAFCEGSAADKKCKVYLESTEQDKNTVQSCDLNLIYSGVFENSVALYNGGDSKAVFAVKDGDDKIKLINVNFKGCQVKAVSVETQKEHLPSYIPFFNVAYIVPRGNKYDLFFRYDKLCPRGSCKATYDYEGNVVKAPANVPEVFLGLVRIEYANNAYVIVKNNHGTVNVYLVKDGDEEKKISPIITTECTIGFMSLSTEENKIAICSYGDAKVICKQTHVDGEPRTINIEIPLNKSTLFPFLDVLNLEKGLLQLSIETTGDKHVIAVTHFDESGKQGKSVRVDPKCSKNYSVPAKLYKNANGQYCVNAFCMPNLHVEDRSSPYQHKSQKKTT